MTPQLRSPPTPSDYDVVACWVTDAAQCDLWAGPNMPFPFSGADLPRLIAAAPPIVPGETSASFVLVDGPAPSAEPVAFGVLVRENRTTFRLARIIVAPARRGCSFGATLCRRLIETAESFPEAELVKLCVCRHNATVRRLYAALGFVESERHPTPQIMAMERTVRRA